MERSQRACHEHARHQEDQSRSDSHHSQTMGKDMECRALRFGTDAFMPWNSNLRILDGKACQFLSHGDYLPVRITLITRLLCTSLQNTHSLSRCVLLHIGL